MMKSRYTEFIIVNLTFISVLAFSNIRILSVLSQLFFVSYVLFNSLRKRSFTVSLHFIWMVTFVFVAFISTLFSQHQSRSISDILNLTSKLIFYTAIIKYVVNKEKFLQVLRAFIFGTNILIIRLIIMTPLDSWSSDRLGFAIGVNPNLIGLILTVSILLSLYLYKLGNEKSKILNIVIYFVVILLTGSRKAFIASVLGPSVYMISVSKKKKELLWSITILLVFFQLASNVVMNNEILYELLGKRLEGLNFISGTANASTNTRLSMIEYAWDKSLESPFFGYGLSNFEVLSSFGAYSHNNYLEILFSTGIVGLVTYYSFYAYVVLVSILRYRHDRDYAFPIALMLTLLFIEVAMVSYASIVAQLILVISFAFIRVQSNIKGGF